MSALVAEDVTTAEVVAPPVSRRRQIATGTVYLAVAALVALMLLAWSGESGSTGFRLHRSNDFFPLPEFWISTAVGTVFFAGIPAVLGVVELVVGMPRRMLRWTTSLVVVCGVFGFLVWAGTGREGIVVDLTGLLSNTLFLAIPLILGAMAGVVSERSGVINIAIEGQMLAAAFTSAMVATLVSNLVGGVLAALVTGAAVGALLAVFAIRYLVNQIVLGVVINLLILGLTNYLYSSMMQRDAQTFNNPDVFQPVAIPVLSRIPLIGPLLFDANVLVYATFVVVVLVQVMLFHSRWGLRTRSVGEHPRAADTLGIHVNRTRYLNSLWAGAIAGLGGAAISIGSVGAFGANMTAGKGFIALAAVIFGRWTPIGAVGAALLFAFSTALKTLLSITGTPVEIPSQFLSMLPYVVTIVVVAGVVGRVRPPAADGIPYTKG